MSPVQKLHLVARKRFVDITGGSQSIEDWSKEIIRIYERGHQRPELLVLILERWGECYYGALYISKADFEQRQQAEIAMHMHNLSKI